MPERRILIADDTPHKLKALREVASARHPNAVIDTAETVAEAVQEIDAHGERYDEAIIDFDFPAERNNGTEIIRQLRRRNTRAFVVCATAREEGESFDEAKDLSLAAGADEALCFLRDDFAQSFSALVPGARNLVR